MASQFYQYVRNLIREKVESSTTNALYLIQTSNNQHASNLFSQCVERGWEEAFTTKDVILAMVRKCPRSWLQLVISLPFRKYRHWLSDLDVASESCQKNSSLFQYIDKSLQKNDAVIQVALRTHHHNLGYLPNERILSWIPSTPLKEKYALQAVTLNGLALQYVPTKTDVITMAAIQHNGQALEFATSAQKNNLKFVRIAFDHTPSIVNQSWFPQFLQLSRGRARAQIAAFRKEYEQRQEDEMNQSHWNHDQR